VAAVLAALVCAAVLLVCAAVAVVWLAALAAWLVVVEVWLLAAVGRAGVGAVVGCTAVVGVALAPQAASSAAVAEAAESDMNSRRVKPRWILMLCLLILPLPLRTQLLLDLPTAVAIPAAQPCTALRTWHPWTQRRVADGDFSSICAADTFMMPRQKQRDHSGKP
jgi:hypothetical protein